jgi:myo-inositol-1(or 4)-monophosphatase
LGRFKSAEGRALKQWMKSPGALVTDADVESDRVIAETLRRHRVPGRVLSEESSSGPSRDGLTWLIDPLCGTYPFSTGMVHWGVNIALRRSNEFEVAALALPALGETLVMSRGGGVTRNGRPLRPTGNRRSGGDAAPFAKAKMSDVAVGLEIDGGETWRRLMKRGLGWVPQCAQVNTFASAAYPMGLVGLGRLAALVIYGVEPVHMAAGAAIALELGLRVTDATGAPADWSGDGELPVVVAGWPGVHSQLIEAMQD